MGKDKTTISVNGGPQVPLDLAMKAADKIMGKDKPKTESRMLMCQLTDDEQRIRGIEMADWVKRLDELENQKRVVAEQIKYAEAQVALLAEAVKHRQEERSVTCTLTPDFQADTMTIRRTDSGAVVHVRQLTFNERQPDLLDMSEGKPGAKPEAPAAPKVENHKPRK